MKIPTKGLNINMTFYSFVYFINKNIHYSKYLPFVFIININAIIANEIVRTMLAPEKIVLAE